MSNADPAEVSMVVSRDGVTVEKSFEPDDFPVPAIAFVIRAERDEAVTVRLSDQVPDQVDAEDIGFHPKYGSEFWSVEDGNIVFDREFEAGEEYTTVYGLRASQTDDVESYMSEPTLEEVDPPLDDAGQVVRNVIGEEEGSSADDIEAAIAAAGADSVDADEDAEDDADDEPIEPLRLNDPNSEGGVEQELAAEEPEPDADDRVDDEVEQGVAEAEPDSAVAGAGTTPDDPVSALAQQIRTGSASEEDLAALRRALGGGGGDGSRDARIKQLQSELADLRAYTNALEEFLDENGDAQQLIRDVKGSVERVDDQLSSVESRAETAVTRVGEVEGSVERVDEELDSLTSEVTDARSQAERVESRMDEFTETVERVEGEVEELHGDVDELSADIDSVHEEVDSVHEEVDSVHEEVDAVNEDVSAVEEEVDDVHESVGDLEADVGDLEESLDRVGDLDDRLDSLEAEFAEAREDLQSLSQMREQLSSVFGAQVQGPGDDGTDDESEEE